MALNNGGGGGINNGGGAVTSESDPTALKLVGGQMSNGAVIDIRDVPNNSDVEVAGWGFGVEQTDASTTGATLQNTGLHVYSAGSGINVSASAITFPDGTTQTTATLQGPQGPQGQNGNDGSSGIGDTSYDNIPYIRYNASWQPLSSFDQQGGGGISDAPANGTAYVRYNNDWQPFSNFDQNSGGGGGGWSYDFSAIVSSLTNGATSSINGSQPSAWQVLKFDGSQIIWSNDNEGSGGGQGPQGDQGPMGGSFSDAPYDSTSYVRINNSWAQTFRDLQGNGSGDPFYPFEVKITVNGTDYWTPVRPV